MKQAQLAEYDQEIVTTRRFLERIPAKDAAWKPHPKSATLGDLAVHLANIPSWVVPTMTTAELDVSTMPPPAPFRNVEALLADFDAAAREGRSAIAAAADADFAAPWSLKNGGQTYFTLPRAAVLRSFVLSHLIHHRAQLGVYLRLHDVPLPSSYGPTADTAD